MRMNSAKAFVLGFMAIGVFIGCTPIKLLSQENFPGIETALSNLDQQINQGAYADVSRTSGQLLNLIFAEIKAHPPKSFEPSRVKIPVAGTAAELLSQTEMIRQAVRKPDLILARDLAMQFSIGKILQQSAVPPSVELQNLEAESYGKSGFSRFLLLPKLAKAAFESGDFAKAISYSSEALADSATYQKQWPTGTAVHYGNIIQGRVLLSNKDIAGASAHLIAAGQTSGSPALDTFGPNMALASELLIQGERQSVIKYLSECATFWKSDGGKLNSWTALIEQGQIPDFGPNLMY